MDNKEKELSPEEYEAALTETQDKKTGDLLTDPKAVAESSKSDGEWQKGPGLHLKTMREKKGMTTAELSTATGIDEALISEVESGMTLLPLGSLIKMGEALSLRIRDVIGAGGEPFTVVRAAERTASNRFGASKRNTHGYAFESLAANKAGRKMEPFVVTLTRTASPENSFHGGQEFIHVLTGEIELVLEDRVEILTPGDSAYYESKVPHHIKALTETATLLAVLTD